MLNTEQFQDIPILDRIPTKVRHKKGDGTSKARPEVGTNPVDTSSDDVKDRALFIQVEVQTGTRIDPEKYFIHDAVQLGNWMRPPELANSKVGWNRTLVAGLVSKKGRLSEEAINEILSETAYGCIRSLPKYQKEVGGLNLQIIYKIMFNKHADYFRKLSRTKNLEVENGLLDLVELSRAPNLTYSLILIEALESLNEIDRQVLLLKYLVGLNVSEVAELVGTKYKATESRLARARNALLTALEGTDSELLASL